jgi:stage III sporulation protein AE
MSSVLSGLGGNSGGAMELAGVLAIGLVCVGQASGFFSLAAETIDAMATFSGFLFTSLAAATAATGAVGTAGALYGVTVAVCGSLSRVLELLFLPAISCYMALMIANYALGDDSLRAVGDTIRQLSTSLLKLLILGFTAYLSLTGVIRGSADSAAVKAAKLAISSAVPVVGSMIADASETLLVSAGLLRSGIGVFGLLGVLAISIGPFLETGISYLMLKLTAAAASVTGEKRLSGLISAMAGAMGLITAVTGVCTLLMMIGCVCFMKEAM